MKEILLSILAGIVIGIVFKVLRLPIPAPPVLAGVMGIFGVYLGSLFASWMYKLFF
ncbi:XapX domain-containing protein [Bacillus taeanensis]|uniref:XapX domain protein n=1 Tax=Bacillus taeanensis TaxID=273032 RepID=A0A366XTH3_9BACI|nr:DUF1427 family protein [Bacillus taeanensis]RBW68966.1 XapX domain protein [Bacillus taeanensis]